MPSDNGTSICCLNTNTEHAALQGDTLLYAMGFHNKNYMKHIAVLESTFLILRC